MSAGGIARLGVRCSSPSSGMATLGIFCPDEEVEGAMVRKPRESSGYYLHQKPEKDRYLAQALQEDEDFIILCKTFIEIVTCR